MSTDVSVIGGNSRGNTHLKDPTQECDRARHLYSVCVPGINVHSQRTIGSIKIKSLVWCQPFCHTPNHDAYHSKGTWRNERQAS